MNFNNKHSLNEYDLYPIFVCMPTFRKSLKCSLISYPIVFRQFLQQVQQILISSYDHHILSEYRDVFPEEVPGLPLRRDIDFSIELAPGAVPVSRTPYTMSTPELVELKLQLKEMMEKGYI